jgi:hypothetical protein
LELDLIKKRNEPLSRERLGLWEDEKQKILSHTSYFFYFQNSPIIQIIAPPQGVLFQGVEMPKHDSRLLKQQTR